MAESITLLKLDYVVNKSMWVRPMLVHTASFIISLRNSNSDFYFIVLIVWVRVWAEVRKIITIMYLN